MKWFLNLEIICCQSWKILSWETLLVIFISEYIVLDVLLQDFTAYWYYMWTMKQIIESSVDVISKQWHRTSEHPALPKIQKLSDLVRVACSCCLWKINESWWCVINVTWLFIITLHWMVTNWSSLETCLRSVIWFKVQTDLNTLSYLKVSWSTKPIWNICIIWCFSSVI
jgi:hypothetical protein